MKVLIVDKLSPETVPRFSNSAWKWRSARTSRPRPCPACWRDGYPRGPLDQGDGGGHEAAPQLSLIIRAGGRYHRPGRRQRAGHLRGQLPRQNTAAVAELAIGLLVAADRRMLVDATMALQNGSWRKRNSARPAAWPAAPWGSSASAPSAGPSPSGPWGWK